MSTVDQGQLFKISDVVRISNMNSTNTLLCSTKDSHILSTKITVYFLM